MLDRKTKPLPAGEINFSLPEINEFETENGLKILFVRKDNLPLIYFRFLSNAGCVFDPHNKKGLANLTSMMLDEGAGEYDALQLSDEIDILGSNLSTSIDEDNLFVSVQTLRENMERSFELMSKVITEPHLSDNDFQREKRKVLTRILQRKDHPDDVADHIFEYNLYGKDNPYSNLFLGNGSDVNAISVNDIRSYYNEQITVNNSCLIAVGSTSGSELKDLSEKYLGNWKSKKKTKEKFTAPLRKSKMIVFSHKENAMQSEIRIGHPASGRNEENYFARILLNTILGGQFTSRINLNLRENKGYTYGAFSRFNYYKHGAHFSISTSVSTENTGNAVREILNELKAIKDGITKDELDFAQASLIRKFPANFETYSQIAGNLTGKIVFSLPDDYFNTYLDNIRKVTIDDVNEAALNEILTENLLIAVVGDKNKITGQFAEFTDTAIVEVDSDGNEIK